MLSLYKPLSEVVDVNDDDDLEDIDMDDSTDNDDEVKTSPATDLEARRRLEARLEERRLNKLIQDYDFDFDDIA